MTKTKIYKTRLYKVKYNGTGGVDTYSGKFILSSQWLMNLIDKGNATLRGINDNNHA